MPSLLLNSLMILVAVLPTNGFYQFSIDQDGLNGAPDFSFLNHPLRPADRLFIKEDHFYRVGLDLQPHTGDDERVRLFGVNLAFGANFPAEPDAARIAKRLRRLGINLVRLHHMDSSPDSTPEDANSLLTTGPYPSFNPISIQRLRTFLTALSAEGIYADLNLHVGYQFRPSIDQVPSLGAVQFPDQSKPLHIFFPRMVELQMEYTRQLLESLRLKDDPVLGVVEINNESSLVDAYTNSWLETYLVGEYRTQFQHQWNSFLSSKYSTTIALRTAWGNTQSDGPELLTGQWEALEIHPGADATFLSASNAPEIQIKVNSGSNWVILKQVGFSIAAGQSYLAEVEMKADLPGGKTGEIYWDVKQDVSPWDTISSRTIPITSQWQKFSMTVVPSFSMDRIGRFGLSVEKVIGVPIHIRNASLRLAGKHGLASGETLEAGNISLVSESEIATEARLNDYLAFLVDRDGNYLNQMQSVIREKTDLLVPVAGTQMAFGGLLNMDSHQDLGYQDNHFYQDHYYFPNEPWDDRDWAIRDSSSVGGGLEQYLNLAASREGGRPYTVSEFNQPWPNTHAAEIDPTLAAFGALQDWDGLMHFAYSHGRNWDDGVPNGFNMNGDWTKFPNFGQAAWLFRSGAIESSVQPLELPLSFETRLQAGRNKSGGWSISSFLENALGFVPLTALKHRVSLAKDRTNPIPPAAQEKLAFPIVSDTGETSFDGARRLFLIHASRAAGVFGFPGSQIVTAGAIDLELGPSARGFVSLLLTPVDGRPLPSSARMLLSTPGYTLPTEPGSNPAKPLPLVNYGSSTDWWTLKSNTSKPSGTLNNSIPPVWMERVESFVTLRSAASQLTVYPLDGKGARLGRLSDDDVQKVEGGFRIHLQADGQTRTPWYELVAQEISSSPVEKVIQERESRPQHTPHRSR